MEVLESESQQIRDIYAQYGVAIYYAQCVERELAILAPMLHGMTRRNTTRKDFEKLLEEFFRGTLGTAIRKLETSVGLPPGFEERLRRALALRNFLAHNFFWDRAGDFTHERGRAHMLTELFQAASFLERLDDELSVITRDWSRKNGVTDDLIRTEMRKLTAPGIPMKDGK
jgi:hypothetical protein